MILTLKSKGSFPYKATTKLHKWSSNKQKFNTKTTKHKTSKTNYKISPVTSIQSRKEGLTPVFKRSSPIPRNRIANLRFIKSIENPAVLIYL